MKCPGCFALRKTELSQSQERGSLWALNCLGGGGHYGQKKRVKQLCHILTGAVLYDSKHRDGSGEASFSNGSHVVKMIQKN